MIWGGFAPDRQAPSRSNPWPGRPRTAHRPPPAAEGILRHEPTPSQAPAPEPSPRRKGSIHANGPSDEPAHRTLVLQLNSKTLTMFVSLGGVAAFLAVVLLGNQVVTPNSAVAAVAAVNPVDSEGVPLTLRLEQTSDGPADQPPVPFADHAAGAPSLAGMSIDEYGRQVAVATLTSGLHEITNTSITFYRDPNEPGNAVQQFARKFGRAIATGRNPTPFEHADRR